MRLGKSAAILGVCILAIAGMVAAASSPSTKASATVYVSNDDDSMHASAVHIGNRFLLTAAHVTDGSTSLKIMDSLGRVTHAAVLWQNKTYDVALMLVEPEAELKTSPLSCRLPRKGETLMLEGSPYDMKFVSVWVKVIGSLMPLAGVDFSTSEVLPVAGVLLPGMSGGPALDAGGNVVGLNDATVGGVVGFIVPGPTICKLLGRQ